MARLLKINSPTVGQALQPPFARVPRRLGYAATITPGGSRVSYDPATTTYPDGTLIAANGTVTIYLIQNGQLRSFPNSGTLNAMGYSGKQVYYVSQAVLNSIPMGSALPDVTGPPPVSSPTLPPTPAPAPVQYSDGTLIAATGTATIYLIQNGSLNWFPDMTTLVAMGYSGIPVTYVSQAVLNSIPMGSEIPEASVVATSPISTVTSSPAAAAIPAITGVVAATMQAGAVWDASINGYVNPDGSVYYAPSTTSSIDFTSPSTWPVWMWAVAAGAAWFVFLKKK